MSPDHIHYFDSAASAAIVLQQVIGDTDVVLIKGSRAAGLDLVVDMLCGGAS